MVFDAPGKAWPESQAELNADLHMLRQEHEEDALHDLPVILAGFCVVTVGAVFVRRHALLRFCLASRLPSLAWCTK